MGIISKDVVISLWYRWEDKNWREQYMEADQDTEHEGVPGIPEQYQAEPDLTHLKEAEDVEEEKKRQEPRGIYS